ncbi:MAG: response regulator [Planctomycetes bacterium]|nr:response regulator [Planctomycetota bacterium]
MAAPTFLAILATLGEGAPLLETLDGLLDQAAFGVYVDHPVQGCVYANSVLLEQFALSWEEFRGFGWARCVHPDDVERFQEAIRRFEHSLEPFFVSYRIAGADGGSRWLRAQVHALRDATGAHVGSVAITNDVTSERAQADRTAQAQKLEAIGRLAGRVAHDFNNLLSAIYAAASVIAPEVHSPAGKECLEAIDSAVESAQQVTNYLLTLSRHKVHGRPCCPDAELAQLEPLLRRTLGESIDLELVTQCAGAWVPLDPGHFSQVVINLAVNARDAMPQGGTVAIVTRRDGEQLVFELRDSGPGIAPDVMRRAFEPFYTTKEAGRGTGLGLSTVKDLVQLAAGEVALISAPEGGTLARLRLPVLDLRPEDDPPDVEPLRSASGARVLLVDDHDALRQSLSYALAMHGYRVTAARDLREARARLAAEQPDALVLDVLLPDGQGVELLRELRADYPTLPVILTSGFAGEASAGLADDLAQAHTAFLPKPVRPRDLVRALAKLLPGEA